METNEQVTEQVTQDPSVMTQEIVEPTETTAPIEPEATSAESGEPETPEWEPSYSYKVRDEEKEFDEWAKPFIKDEQTYKNFQDLYTRGHGLELAKNERDEYKQKLGTLEESLGVVNELVQKNDARGFIEALGLPKKMFIDYAINELKFQELPPEEQQKINAQRQQELQMQQLQARNSELETSYQTEVRTRRENELQSALNTTYNGAVQAYEQRTGVPGSFRQLVIDRGIYHHHVSGVDIPVEQAINEAIQIAGVQAGTPNHSQPVATGTPTVQPQTTKKVLPNLQGSGSSPTKPTISNLEALKAHRKQKYGF